MENIQIRRINTKTKLYSCSILLFILICLNGEVSAYKCCKRDYYQTCIAVTINNNCVSLCNFANQPCPVSCFVLDEICVNSCPSGSYLDLTKPRFCGKCNESCSSCYGPSDSECHLCATGYYQNGHDCVSYCPKPSIAYHGKCVSNCPAISFNGSCIDTCPVGYYKANLSCNRCDVECVSCSSAGPFACSDCKHVKFNNTCMSSCPKEAPFMNNNSCTEHCPNFSANFTCVDKCDKGLYHLQNTCIKSCPVEYKYVSKNECVSKCSAFRVNETCVEECPRDMFLVENCCASVCPSDYPYTMLVDNQVTCMKSCEYYVYQHFCVSKCPDLYVMVIFNGTCLYECPPSHPVVNLTTRQCEKQGSDSTVSCAHNTYMNDNTGQCLTCDQNCKGCSGPSNHDCYECVHFNSTQGCVALCPNAEPYLVNGSKGQFCSSECPENKVSDKVQMMCLDHCTGNLKYEVHSECVETCPEGTVAIPGTNSIKCVSHCLNNTFQHGMHCVPHCPQSDPFIYRNGCISKCPKEAYLIEGEHICLDACAKGYLVFEKLCLKKCSLDVYNDNKCLVSCPEYNYKVTLDKEIEFSDSIKEFITYGSVKCNRECPVNAVYYPQNSCIDLCPDSATTTNNRSKSCPSNSNITILISVLKLMFIVICIYSCKRLGSFNKFKHMKLSHQYLGKNNITSTVTVLRDCSSDKA